MKILPYYIEDSGAKFSGAISLMENVESISEEDALLVANYMNSCIVIDEWLSNTVDLISNKLVIPSKTWSDGFYVWDTSHIHYVKEYRARLPSAFLEHVKKQILLGVDMKKLNKDIICVEFEKMLQKIADGDESVYDGTYIQKK